MTDNEQVASRAVGGSAVVDAHTHVACADTARFPTRPTGVGSDWWADSAGAVDTLLADLDAAFVARAVVVQAVGAYGHDCRCAADAVAAHPGRLALVASVDMAGPDPAAAVLALADDLGGSALAGVRLFGVGAGVGAGAGAPTWLTDGRAADVCAAVETVGSMIVPTLFTPDLDALAVVVARYPGLAVAVDHCGFPDREGAAGWEAVLRLADVGNVSLKVSSHVLEGGERNDGDPAVVVDRLVATFGTRRLCWGSDHPQDQALDYPEKLALARRATRNLDADQAAWFFDHTARSLWFSP